MHQVRNLLVYNCDQLKKQRGCNDPGHELKEIPGLAQLPKPPRPPHRILWVTLKVQHFAGALLLSPPGTLTQAAKPREPCPPAPKKLPLHLFCPKYRLCPLNPQQTLSKPSFSPTALPMPAQRGQRVPASPRARIWHLPRRAALPQESYQQLPGAPAHTPISAGLHRGAGVSAAPVQPQHQCSSAPAPLQLSSAPCQQRLRASHGTPTAG